MEFETKLVKILLEAGILAGEYQWQQDAEHIFQGLFAMRPDAEEPFIGLALTKIMANASGEAVRILRDEALRVHPDSALLQAYLALALKQAGNIHESENLARGIVAAGKDAAAVRFASAVLDEGV